MTTSQRRPETDRVDVETIRESARQACAPRLSIPISARIDQLTERLQGHIALLLEEDLGGEDDELHRLRAEAELLLKSDPGQEASRPDRWHHVEVLGACTKGLLRRYEEARAAA